MQFSPIFLILFLFLLSFLFAIIQFGIVTLSFGRLGLSPDSVVWLLFGSLVGSAINIPLFTIRTGLSYMPALPVRYGLLHHFERKFRGQTLIALNVGGALIPILFSVYLLFNNNINMVDIILAISGVTWISYRFSRPIMGLGIAMPVFIAPLSAALIALIINPEQAPSLAYIAGTMGVLIGADLLRLKDIGKLGTPVASIGGAGTFDGIFITGILAVLLT